MYDYNSIVMVEGKVFVFIGDVLFDSYSMYHSHIHNKTF